MATAKHDENRVPTIIGVSSVDLSTPTLIRVNPATGAIKANVTAGDATTVDAGTTTTGNAGTDALVVNSGTTSAAVFDFTIPRGNTGATGSQGIQGIPGVVQSIDAGNNISVNETDPANPIVTATPSGDDTQVQFNDGWGFGGDSAFTFNKTTNVLTVEDISGVSGVPLTIITPAVNGQLSNISIISGNALSGNNGGGDLTLVAGNALGDEGVITGIILDSGGTGYTVNDVLTLDDGNSDATVTVNTVDGSGVILTFTLTTAGTDYFPGTMDGLDGTGSNASFEVTSSSESSGIASLTAGNAGESGTGGTTYINGGDGGTAGGLGGNIEIVGGDALFGDTNGGSVVISGGNGFGTGKTGSVQLSGGGSSITMTGGSGFQLASVIHSIQFPNTGDATFSLGSGTSFYIKNSDNGAGALLSLASIATSDKTFTFPNTTGTLGLKNQEITAYGVGTAYSLTNTAATIDFGTTDPSIVLNAAGTYLIMGQVNLAYTGATVVAETATIKVRRTNNTAADLSAVVVLDLPVSTVLTHTYGVFQIPPFVYTTTLTDDSITLFGNVSAGLSAGTIDATAIGTSLVAVRLY